MARRSRVPTLLQSTAVLTRRRVDEIQGAFRPAGLLDAGYYHASLRPSSRPALVWWVENSESQCHREGQPDRLWRKGPERAPLVIQADRKVAARPLEHRQQSQ